MWEIDERLDVSAYHLGRNKIYLNSDKQIDTYHITYPITWKGLLNGNKVEITQKTSSSSFMDDYEFVIYPEEFSDLKGEIVQVIDRYLRILD